MNFLNLYYFNITAEELSFTKAAKRLFITPQSLSNHISRLENEFGVTLFNRTQPMTLRKMLQRSRDNTGNCGGNDKHGYAGFFMLCWYGSHRSAGGFCSGKNTHRYSGKLAGFSLHLSAGLPRRFPAHHHQLFKGSLCKPCCV